jgi:hypothetical protein
MAGKQKGSEQRGKGGNQPQREQGAGQSREGGGEVAQQPVRQPAQEVGKQRPDERSR